MLQRSASRVECKVNVIIQKTAERSHVDIRETTQASGEKCWVVTSSEDAAKMRVEKVLHHKPAKDQPGQFGPVDYWGGKKRLQFCSQSFINIM